MPSSNLYEQEILDEVDRLNLTQIIDFFTIKPYILDLVFVNNADNVDAARVHKGIYEFLYKISSFSITLTVGLLSTGRDFRSSPFSSTK